MRIISIIAALAIVCSASLPVMSAGGHVPSVCTDGTPEGWQRPGGFCELAARGPERASKKKGVPDEPAEPEA